MVASGLGARNGRPLADILAFSDSSIPLLTLVCSLTLLLLGGITIPVVRMRNRATSYRH